MRPSKVMASSFRQMRKNLMKRSGHDEVGQHRPRSSARAYTLPFSLVSERANAR